MGDTLPSETLPSDLDEWLPSDLSASGTPSWSAVNPSLAYALQLIQNQFPAITAAYSQGGSSALTFGGGSQGALAGAGPSDQSIANVPALDWEQLLGQPADSRDAALQDLIGRSKRLDQWKDAWMQQAGDDPQAAKNITAAATAERDALNQEAEAKGVPFTAFKTDADNLADSVQAATMRPEDLEGFM